MKSWKVKKTQSEDGWNIIRVQADLVYSCLVYGTRYVHYNLFLTLLLGSMGETMFVKQPYNIQTKNL